MLAALEGAQNTANGPQGTSHPARSSSSPAEDGGAGALKAPGLLWPAEVGARGQEKSVIFR